MNKRVNPKQVSRMKAMKIATNQTNGHSKHTFVFTATTKSQEKRFNGKHQFLPSKYSSIKVEGLVERTELTVSFPASGFLLLLLPFPHEPGVSFFCSSIFLTPSIFPRFICHCR